MNRRRFIQSVLGALAALPFAPWLGKKQADNTLDIPNIFSRGNWASGDTIVFPIDIPANATITSVRVYDHDENEIPTLNIDYGGSFQPYSTPDEVGYLGSISLPKGTAFVTLDGDVVVVDE